VLRRKTMLSKTQIISEVLKAVQAVLDKRLPNSGDDSIAGSSNPAQLSFPFGGAPQTTALPVVVAKRKPGRKPLANPTPEQLERRQRRERAHARKQQRAAMNREPAAEVDEHTVELEVELPKPLSFVIDVPVTGDFV
jgi:hypothetical protein